MATKKKSAAPAAAEAAAESESAESATIRLFPTHKRSSGPLSVSLPAVDGNSPDPLVIDDDGADVPAELAAHLVNAGEATTDKPEPEA